MATSKSAEWADFYAQVNGAALSRYPGLLQTWFPAGQLAGSEFECGNLNGASGKSFKININTGRWADFATGESGGDPIDLYAQSHSLKNGDAALALGRELGISPPRLKRAPDNAWRPVTPIPDGVKLELPAGHPPGPPAAAWLYLDAQSRPIMYRVRFDLEGGGKEVLPLTWSENHETGERAWRWKDLPAPRPLYNVEKLAAAPNTPVLVVEGEKCVDIAEETLGADWIIVTWPGGAKRASRKDTDWTPLKGRKVWIWPDNDDPGKSAALVIADVLTPKPLIIRPDPTWPEGYDIADLVKAGWDRARVLEFIERNAVPVDIEPLKFKRIPVDLTVQDLDTQTQAIWTAVAACNIPPSLLTAPYGLMVVDRDLFGRARQRVADEGLLRNWLVSRMAFTRLANHGHEVSVHPPDTLLTNVLVGTHPVPRLTRVTEVPIFTPDARLIAREGFDEASGVYYLPGPGLEGLEAPASPTPTDAMMALNLLDDMLCDFPFLEDCDRSHALAFAMLPLVRMAIRGRTPMFRFEAPAPGTGKSMLMRLLARLTAITITDISPTEDEEEWRKRITAALSQDPDAVLIDNAEKLESAHLKKLLTDDVWEDRALGTSRNVRYPVRAVFGVSLNNPLISRETIRRSLRVRLDARQEHPEQRTGWRHLALEEYVAQNRAELVSALVTLAQFGMSTGGDGNDLPTLGGFEAFSRRMGAIMRTLDLPGFLEDRKDESMLSDEEIAARAFVAKWGETHGEAQVSTSQLLDIAESVVMFYLGKAESKRGKQIVLGKWLSKRRGMVFGNWKIMNRLDTREGAVWRLQNLSQMASGGGVV